MSEITREDVGFLLDEMRELRIAIETLTERAALRSDSPESREGVKVEAYPGPGDDEITIAVEGHDDWLTIVDSDAGTRITEPMVGYLRPASTGGERDEPDTPYDPNNACCRTAYRDGKRDALKGAVPVKYQNDPASTGGERPTVSDEDLAAAMDRVDAGLARYRTERTGGEREEPSEGWAQHLQDTYDEGKAAARRELEQTPGYIHGFNTGFDAAMEQEREGAVPVEVTADSMTMNTRRVYRSDDVPFLATGSYWLLPRTGAADG